MSQSKGTLASAKTVLAFMLLVFGISSNISRDHGLSRLRHGSTKH